MRLGEIVAICGGGACCVIGSEAKIYRVCGVRSLQSRRDPKLKEITAEPVIRKRPKPAGC